MRCACGCLYTPFRKGQGPMSRPVVKKGLSRKQSPRWRVQGSIPGLKTPGLKEERRRRKTRQEIKTEAAAALYLSVHIYEETH
jgi:hypothetical protein